MTSYFTAYEVNITQCGIYNWYA